MDIQELVGFDTDLETLAGPSLLPEASHDPIDQDDGEISDAATFQHPLGLVSRNEVIARMASDSVAVEMWQEAHHILRQREGHRRFARQQSCMVALDIHLLQFVGQLPHQSESYVGLHAKPRSGLAVRGRPVGGEKMPQDPIERLRPIDLYFAEIVVW